MANMMGIAIIIGAIIASMGFATYMYYQYQPNFKHVNSGEPVQVGPVVYTVEHIAEHNGNEDTRPEGIFFQIRIMAENVGTDTTRMHGGQFYILDEDDNRSQPVYGDFSEEDLFNDHLEPNTPVIWTTQFDIKYDENMQYRIGILPTKEQSSIDIGIVCVQNC